LDSNQDLRFDININMTLRKKILLYLSGVVLVCALGFYPLIIWVARKVVLEDRRDIAQEMAALVSHMQTEQEMITFLRGGSFFAIAQVMVLNSHEEIIFDSIDRSTPLSKIKQPSFDEIFYIDEPFRLSFERYTLRLGFLEQSVKKMQRQYVLHFYLFALCIVVGLCCSAVWLFHFVLFPLRAISTAMQHARERHQLPYIPLTASIASDPHFLSLSSTINGLSQQVEVQLQTIQQERNEKETILDALGEGIIAVEKNEKVLYVNFTATKILNIPKRSLIGRALGQLGEEHAHVLLRKIHQLIEKKGEMSGSFTHVVVIQDASKKFFDLSIFSQTGGDKIIVIQDKTSHYKALEIGKDFISNAAHELRTPITVIRGFAETLKDLPDLSRQTFLDIADKISESSQKMDLLIRNLLLLADIENLPEVRFQQCNLIDLLECCSATTRRLHPEIYLVVEKKDNPIFLSCVPDLLELAIHNLLENAVKYSSSPAHIRIETQQLQESVRVAITDRGIGISADDQQRIFERFYAVDRSRSRRLGGSGLGLSIVKMIMDKHGGTISVSSTLGQGSCFILMFPHAPPN